MLRLSHVSKTYPGGVHALKDVSLTIPTGMFGLLGPNGAGKSTLMRTIATLQPPDTGEITFDGIDVLLTNQETNQAREVVTNTAGLYEFRALPRGVYTLEAEVTGFKKEQVRGVQLIDAEEVAVTAEDSD